MLSKHLLWPSASQTDDYATIMLTLWGFWGIDGDRQNILLRALLAIAAVQGMSLSSYVLYLYNDIACPAILSIKDRHTDLGG